MITTSSRLKLTSIPARPPKTTRVIYDCKNANFKGLRAALASSNLCDLVSEMDYVPMKKVKTRRNVPWLTSEIRHLLKIKETVRRKLARSPSDYLQAKFKYLRAQAKQALKLSRKQYYDCLGKTMYSNPKRFWKLFKLNSRTSNIPQSVLWKTENDQKVANNSNIDCRVIQ